MSDGISQSTLIHIDDSINALSSVNLRKYKRHQLIQTYLVHHNINEENTNSTQYRNRHAQSLRNAIDKNRKQGYIRAKNNSEMLSKLENLFKTVEMTTANHRLQYISQRNVKFARTTRKRARKSRNNRNRCLRNIMNPDKTRINHFDKTVKCIKQANAIYQPCSDIMDWVFQWRICPFRKDNVVHVYPVYGQHREDSLDSFFDSCGNDRSLSSDNSMNFEWIRLRTYASLSCGIQLSPITLSRIGFYYLGRGTEMKCYSCGIVNNEWNSCLDPLELHRRLSPNCRHLAGTDESNVPIGHRDSMSSNTPSITANETNVRTENTEIVTGANASNNSLSQQQSHCVRSQNYAASNAGQNTYLSKDVSALERISNTNGLLGESGSVEQSQTNSHTTVNVQQSFYGRASVTHGGGNQHNENQGSGVSSTTINKLTPLGVNFDKPRYPQYAVITVRMSTYNGWPATQQPKKMAEAGFIYAGYADYTRCFFCGGGLRNWEEGDDPWIEHARWFPRCTYVKQNKGDQFVQLVLERLQEMVIL